MGSSGSGKSTLMNVLGCLDRPTKGRYLLDGIDVSGLDRNELADLRNQKLGFVFQGFNLLSRTTARENVELPMLYGKRKFSASELHERAMHSLDIVGLSKRADHFPSQLSGGQQQRVAIARALINDPQILLADEPTGNLDSKTSVEIMGVFQKLNEQGITIVMVTHELDIAQYCKRNLIMRDGRLVSDIQVANRFNATEEMQKIVTAESQAKLTD
jgi:putative ABC transport system ATP-binding protein